MFIVMKAKIEQELYACLLNHFVDAAMTQFSMTIYHHLKISIKLDEVKEKERLDAITKYFFNELVYTFISAKDSAAKRQDSYKDANFYQIAKDYLKLGNMDDEQINQLKTIFSKP